MDNPTSTLSRKSLDTLPEYRASSGAGSPSSPSTSGTSGPSSIAPPLPDVDHHAADEAPPAYIENPPAFRRYSASQRENSDGVIISHDRHLNSDVEAMYQWLHTSASTQPPRPFLKIEGWHNRRKPKGDDEHVTDFYLTFDLSEFLKDGFELRPAAPMQSRRRGTRDERVATQAEVEAALDVRGWCDAYIHHPAHLKEFTLYKRLVRLDDWEVIRTHVESMVRSTNYCGQVDIWFSTEKRSVVLSPDNRVCRVRYGWARWLFYLSFLWVITWPVLWVFTKRWDVVDAVYQCETDVQREREWVERWRWFIIHLVREKSHRYTPLTPIDLSLLRCIKSLEAIKRSMGERVEHEDGSWGHDE